MRRVTVVLAVLILILGAGIFLYPILSNLYSTYFQTRAIDDYHKIVQEQTPEELDAKRKEWTEKNAALAGGAPISGDPFAQTVAETEPINNDGVVVDALSGAGMEPIAVLHLPSIDVNLPVYEGVGELQLQKGAGLLPGTSYPVGGSSTHSVITGHRGLPTAKLFSDLPDVKMGDKFYVEVLGDTLAYEVKDIRVIEPIEVDQLRIVPDKDEITLLTCTPYMVNSHRLIVTGERIDLPDQIENIVDSGGDNPQGTCCLSIIIVIALVVILLIMILFRLSKTYEFMVAEAKRRRTEEVAHKQAESTETKDHKSN